MEKLKLCLSCLKDKQLCEMVKSKAYDDGYLCYCKACMKLKSIKFRIDNPIQQMLSTTKSSAKKRGLIFELTLEDIVIPDVCPYLGIKLEVTPGTGLQPNTPSIDRIDISKGYTKDNIMIISHKANRLKGELTIEELLNFSKNVINIHS